MTGMSRSAGITRCSMGLVPRSPCSRSSAMNSSERPREAATRPCSPSMVHRTPLMPPQRRIAFSSIASNTGVRSPGDELMTSKTSAVAVCCCSATLGPYPARASPACSHSAKCYVVILGVLTARSIPLSLVPSARWKRAIAVSTPHQTPRLRLGLPLPRGSDITGAGLRRAPSSRHCAVDDHVPLRMGCVSLGRFQIKTTFPAAKRAGAREEGP